MTGESNGYLDMGGDRHRRGGCHRAGRGGGTQAQKRYAPRPLRPDYADDYADQDARLTAADDDARLTGADAASGYADRGDPYDSVAAAPEPRASLLEDGELQSMTMRWKDIQAEFVDEPHKAVQEADALVAELMQRLAAMFAGERAGLEERWAGGNRVSTEDLRQGLRRYRSFFERLLAA